MKPAEEDALVINIIGEMSPYNGVGIKEAVRLAIRAAVAHERERAAKVCEFAGNDSRAQYDYNRAAITCAAAIRGGEDA